VSRRIQIGVQTAFHIRHHTLVVDLGCRLRILSSAPRGGGFVRSRYILNHQVPADPVMAPTPLEPCKWCDPARYLGRLAAEVGADSRCVALMTAVPLRNLVVLREDAEGLWVEGFLTVGVSNAVRAGDPSTHRPKAAPGTINIILVTNAHLSAAAMVGAVQVVAEAKTAALAEARVLSTVTGAPATGTGTDATVVASGDGSPIKYSGTHTQLGSMIGRLVGRGVREGLRLQEK